MWMFTSLVFLESALGRGRFDGLNSCSEELYRVCVSNCVRSRDLNGEAAEIRVGFLRHKNKTKAYFEDTSDF